MKKITSLLLTCMMIISIALNITNVSGAIDDAIGGFNISPRTEYTKDTFIDIDENQWYAPSIMLVYELGIMSGKGDRMFDPYGSVLISEAVAMAARVHSIYNGGATDFPTGTPWYQVYVDYAIENSIIQIDDFSDYNKMATRAEMVYIFSNSVPLDEYTEINTIETLPDITETARFGQNVYRLYRAGILTGNDSFGTFTPDANITRAQAAAIIVRVVIPSERRMYSIDTPASMSNVILFDSKPILKWIGSSVADLRDGLGSPDFEGVVWEGGTYGYSYDGINFIKSDNAEVITHIFGTPSLLMCNGTTLDKNRDGLVSLLGSPVFEDWFDNYGEDGYYIKFIIQGIYIATFYMYSPNEQAYDVRISYAD